MLAEEARTHSYVRDGKKGTAQSVTIRNRSTAIARGKVGSPQGSRLLLTKHRGGRIDTERNGKELEAGEVLGSMISVGPSTHVY